MFERESHERQSDLRIYCEDGLDDDASNPISRDRAERGLEFPNASQGDGPKLEAESPGRRFGLAEKLAASEEVAGCVGRQWFRFALGRVESASDACSVQALQDGFEASGGSIRTLLSQIALSDAFRYVRHTAQEMP